MSRRGSDINRALSHTQVSGPGATVFDMYTCSHCNCLHAMPKPWEDEKTAGKMCSGCMQMACPRCAKKIALEGCIVFERKLGIYEAKRKLFQACSLE